MCRSTRDFSFRVEVKGSVVSDQKGVCESERCRNERSKDVSRRLKARSSNQPEESLIGLRRYVEDKNRQEIAKSGGRKGSRRRLYGMKPKSRRSFPMPHRQVADSIHDNLMRRIVVIVEIEQCRHGGDLGVFERRQSRGSAMGDVPAERLKKVACPFPSKEMAQTSHEVPRNGLLVVVVN